MQTTDLQLCLVTDIPKHQPFHLYKQFINDVVQQGVTSVQLRAKHESIPNITRMAHELKELLAPWRIPLIINDHIQVAKAVQAEGVHIGQSDDAPLRARECLGDKVWIGLSIETIDELIHVNQLDYINYVAASAIFKTPSKTNCRTYWGVDGLHTFVAQSIHPVVAIGGIDIHNINKIMACKVSGVAVISAIHHTPAVTSLMIQAIRGE